MIEVLKYFFYFLIIFSSYIFITLIMSEIYLKKFSIKKIKIYGLFMDLKNNHILSLSLLTIKYIFTIYCLFYINNNYLSLIFILIITILYNIQNLRFINLIFDSLLNTILYLIIISKDIFINYIIDVTMIWNVIILYVITIIFGIVCASYVYAKEILFIVKKNKFIKIKENTLRR